MIGTNDQPDLAQRRNLGKRQLWVSGRHQEQRHLAGPITAEFENFVWRFLFNVD
jgi:hypothetical protein